MTASASYLPNTTVAFYGFNSCRSTGATAGTAFIST